MTEAEKLYVRNSMAMKGNGKMFFPDSRIRTEYENFRGRVMVELSQYKKVSAMYPTHSSTTLRLIGCGLLLEKHCDV